MTNNIKVTHPLIEIEWTLLGPNVDEFKKELLERYDVRPEKADIVKDGIPDSVKNRDTIVLDKVLHRQTDIPRYLEKMKEVLRPDGFLMVVETTAMFDLSCVIEALT